MVKRSPNGLRNRSKLLKYDLEVVIETDPSKPSEVASEEKFWRSVAEHYTGLKVRITKRGGKISVLKHCVNLDAAGVKAYFCALDRDYDDLWTPHSNPINTVFTHGYSFESDCISAESVSRTVELVLGGVLKNLPAFQTQLFDKVGLSLWQCRRLVVADQVSVQKGRGFLHRDGRTFQRLVNVCPRSGVISPNLERAHQRFVEIRPDCTRPATRIDSKDLFRRCYGKFLAWIAYETAVFEIRKNNSKVKLRSDFFLNVIVDHTTNLVRTNSFKHDGYYRTQFGKLILG